MKTVRIIIPILFIGILLVPSLSRAVNISVGASTWYTNWKYENEEPGNSPARNMDYTFMYGPALSIGFLKDWSISSAFLYGKFDMEGDFGSTAKIKRYDSDNTLNYLINRYFKVFAGYKYMGFKGIGLDHSGHGVGAGVGLMLPLAENFFLTANLSGMYLKGKQEQENDYNSTTVSYDYNEKGFNGNISLAYYIAPASVSILLGYRYQYFKTEYDDSVDSVDAHRFQGVTLTAVYSFDL